MIAQRRRSKGEATPHNIALPTACQVQAKRGVWRRLCDAGHRAVLSVLLSLVRLVQYLLGGPSQTEAVQLRSFDIRIAALHPSLHGLKVAQLTDIHFNGNKSPKVGTTDDILQQALEIVEMQDVDLVVLTGDYVDYWPETVAELTTEWLAKLKSKHGTVAILGNHDYQLPRSKGLVMEAFERSNITLLINSSVEPINQWLEVVGVGDLWKDYDPESVMSPLPAPEDTGAGSFRKARIVLTHNPDSALDLNRWGSDLMLAGHTHGGQTCLPPGLRELWPLVSYLPYAIRKFIPGANVLKNWELSYGWIDISRRLVDKLPLHENPAFPLYVNRGLSRLPLPFLLGPPEVAVFTLLPV